MIMNTSFIRQIANLTMLLLLVSPASIHHVYAQVPTPPLGGEALLQWLQAGHYKDWHAESGIHESDGPHFGKVRAFLNSTLFDSMNQKAHQHPEGSVAVKELYGDSEEVKGWAVGIKMAEESDGGANWYWYEYFDNDTVKDGKGVFLCSICHRSGQDYVLTPWPLK